MVEQPSNYLLDNLNLEIIIDKNKVSDIALKGTNVTPSFVTTKVSASKKGKNVLEIKLNDTTFIYQVHYPEEKYIILSPYIDKKGKVNIGILKQKEKFIFQ